MDMLSLNGLLPVPYSVHAITDGHRRSICLVSDPILRMRGKDVRTDFRNGGKASMFKLKLRLTLSLKRKSAALLFRSLNVGLDNEKILGTSTWLTFNTSKLDRKSIASLN